MLAPTIVMTCVQSIVIFILWFFPSLSSKVLFVAVFDFHFSLLVPSSFDQEFFDLAVSFEFSNGFLCTWIIFLRLVPLTPLTVRVNHKDIDYIMSIL